MGPVIVLGAFLLYKWLDDVCMNECIIKIIAICHLTNCFSTTSNKGFVMERCMTHNVILRLWALNPLSFSMGGVILSSLWCSWMATQQSQAEPTLFSFIVSLAQGQFSRPQHCYLFHLSRNVQMQGGSKGHRNLYSCKSLGYLLKRVEEWDKRETATGFPQL